MHEKPSAQSANAAAPPPPVAWRAAAVLLTMLAATTILSQFFRASISVIAPELIRDLSLSPEALGFASGSFFIALLLPQIFVGVLFDRIGPRITVSALSVLMVAGALLHSVAESGAGLALARFVVGLGCAGSFMSAVVLISRWYPRQSWSTALSWVFALSQIGFLLAGLPLAVVTEWIGWRTAFVGMAIVAAVAGFLFFHLVRDHPPGREAETTEEELGPIAGLRRVLSTPGLLRVLALFLVAYAAFASVMLVWAGPYLHDVHGLDAIERGRVLLGMAVVQTIAGLVIGPLDRVFNTRKWVAVANATIALGTLLTFALAPNLSLAVAVGLLLLLSSVSAYASVLLAHIRSHFPDHLAGRGATTGNMAQLIGAALLPIITGFIPPLFPHAGPGYSMLAYQWIFATLAIALGAGLAVYLTAKDAKPYAVEVMPSES
ncbi:MAG: MFS transporter [Sphingomonadales bacterium]|nr:MFS transporter [Sphingomonadales bacterium]